jgi:hypothetical protein
MLRILACLVFVLVVPLAASAATWEETHIDLVNETGHFIYVDTYAHDGHLTHVGIVAPESTRQIRPLLHRSYRFFTDVHVYVKTHWTEESSATICHVMKTFGNTTGKPPLQAYVHYDAAAHSCSIDDH